MATVNSGLRSRSMVVTPSAPSIGQEDSQYATELALRVSWANPLTLMTMKLNSETSGTVDVHWWEDELVPYIDQINYGTGYNNSATGFTVDNASRFALGDLVRQPLTDEVVLVTSVGSTFIGVVRDFGQATEGWTALAGSVSDNDYLQIIGNAFEPGHTFPTCRSTTPVERVNYCQNVRTPISIPDQLKNTRMRTGPEMALWEKKANLEHHQKLEMINWFGKPYRSDLGSYAAATGNTAPATAGGVNHYLAYYASASHLVDQDDLTEYEFMDIAEVALDNDAPEMVCYCPRNLLGALAKWGVIKQQTDENTNTLGLNVVKYQGFGKIIHFVEHSMLKRNSTSEYHYAFFLDMRQLKIWYMVGGATTLAPAGDHSTHGATKTDEEYMTTMCLEMKLPDNHLRLRYKTYSV